jgi:hypothetical protein
MPCRHAHSFGERSRPPPPLLLPSTPQRNEACLPRLLLSLFLAFTGAVASAFQAGALPPWLCADADAFVARLLLLEYVSHTAISAATLAEILEDAPSQTTVACVMAYWLGPYLSMSIKSVSLQLPVRLVVLPELARTAVCLALAFVAVAADDPAALTLYVALQLCMLAALAAAVTLVIVSVCHSRIFQREHASAILAFCPAPLPPGGAPGARGGLRLAGRRHRGGAAGAGGGQLRADGHHAGRDRPLWRKWREQRAAGVPQRQRGVRRRGPRVARLQAAGRQRRHAAHAARAPGRGAGAGGAREPVRSAGHGGERAAHLAHGGGRAARALSARFSAGAGFAGGRRGVRD